MKEFKTWARCQKQKPNNPQDTEPQPLPLPPQMQMQKDEPVNFLHLSAALKILLGSLIDENHLNVAMQELEQYLLKF